jgi:hypothetical protein
MKTCNKCEEEKPLDDFYRENKNKDEHMGHCRVCHNKRTEPTGRAAELLIQARAMEAEYPYLTKRKVNMIEDEVEKVEEHNRLLSEIGIEIVKEAG